MHHKWATFFESSRKFPYQGYASSSTPCGRPIRTGGASHVPIGDTFPGSLWLQSVDDRIAEQGGERACNFGLDPTAWPRLAPAAPVPQGKLLCDNDNGKELESDVQCLLLLALKSFFLPALKGRGTVEDIPGRYASKLCDGLLSSQKASLFEQPEGPLCVASTNTFGDMLPRSLDIGDWLQAAARTSSATSALDACIL